MEKISKKLKGLKWKLFFLIFFIFLFLGETSYYRCKAKTLAQNYNYDSIEVDIQINQDSTFDVVEEQTYNLEGSFGYFYRDIELKDLDHISDIKVFNSQGEELNENEYKVSYKGNRISIRWDFPRREFDDELKSWTVKYKVHGGLGFYENWDELYWNAIFEDRTVEVERAEVIVHLPKEFEKEKIGLKLFIGLTGSKTQSSNYEIIDNKTVRFWGYNIKPYNFLTIVVSWPKGAVTKPFLYRNQIINWIVLLIALGLPISIFVKMFITWWKRGKDPKIDKTIIAEYSPPESLPPAMFGVLIDQNVEMKDITATVVDLAVRGYLKIIEKEAGFFLFKKKEHVFQKLKDENDLKPFEAAVMGNIFKGKMLVSSSSLKNKFYKHIPLIQDLVHEEVSKTGYFNGDIQTTRKKYRKKSIFFFALAFLILVAWGLATLLLSLEMIRFFAQIVILLLGLAVSGIIIIVFSQYMPALTKKGLEAKWKLLGFKEYLQIAEKFRIEAETLDTFSRYLPYAMVLGVEKKWANRFSNFSYQKQDWYVTPVYVSGGRGGAPPSFNSLSSSISSFTSSISRTFSARARGTGVGGGFGGGGGAGGGGGGGGGGAG